jgi:ABC-2 type transport system ATP-binding protein
VESSADGLQVKLRFRKRSTATNGEGPFSSATLDQAPAVELVNVRKRYGTKDAVDGASLSIHRGTFTGLVGPNGAGKTTMLRVITGLCRPDTGTVHLLGRPVWPDPTGVRQLMGVLPDDLRLFERLSGQELLVYIGLLHGISSDDIVPRAEQLLDVFGFEQSADELVADYSTGMRKKIALAAALIHAPKILFLDEPFESVDPVSVRVLQDVLRSYQEAGGTVVLSSHVMSTVERLCTYVAIVDRGQIVRSGTVAEVADGGRLEQAFFDAVSNPGASPQVHDRAVPWTPIERSSAHRNRFETATNDQNTTNATNSLNTLNTLDTPNTMPTGSGSTGLSHSEDDLREMAEVR